VTSADLPAGMAEQPHGRWSRATIVKVLVLLVLFGGLALALRGSWARLGEFSWQLDPWAVGASFATMVVASVWAALAWLVVARALGARLDLWPALRIYSTSNLGKYLPGKVLHAAARVYLCQQQGVPTSVASAGVAVDVVLYVAAALLIVALAVPTVLGSVAELDAAVVTLVAAVGLVTGLGLLHPALLNAAFGLLSRLAPSRSLPRVTIGYGTVLRAFMLYLALWLLYGIGFYASASAVYPIGWSTLPLLGGAYALSYLVGTAIAILPAGAVVREGVLTLVLAQVMPEPAALAAAVLVRLVQVAA
jgi:uncharacterized membrane protein YbhN (UPF0104 family)